METDAEQSLGKLIEDGEEELKEPEGSRTSQEIITESTNLGSLHMCKVVQLGLRVGCLALKAGAVSASTVYHCISSPSLRCLVESQQKITNLTAT